MITMMVFPRWKEIVHTLIVSGGSVDVDDPRRVSLLRAEIAWIPVWKRSKEALSRGAMHQWIMGRRSRSRDAQNKANWCMANDEVELVRVNIF